jgi:hypothetical protein
MAAIVLIFGIPMIVAAALISPSALHNLVHGVLFYAIVGFGLPFVGWQTFLAVFAFSAIGNRSHCSGLEHMVRWHCAGRRRLHHRSSAAEEDHDL